jgi:protein ImuA
MQRSRVDIIAKLQTDILRLEGFKTIGNHASQLSLGPISEALPNKTFPLGAVHEFLTPCVEDFAATSGFITGLISTVIKDSGAILWISSSRSIFPPALITFGIQPDRCVFIEVRREKDILWTMEEALKCGALTSVVAELRDLNFTDSRRLQLAVEQSKVTGFILRRSTNQSTTACVSRWNISSLRGELIDNLPGIGYPKWRVELLRIRNGKPGVWELQWKNGRFHYVEDVNSVLQLTKRKAG